MYNPFKLSVVSHPEVAVVDEDKDTSIEVHCGEDTVTPSIPERQNAKNESSLPLVLKNYSTFLFSPDFRDGRLKYPKNFGASRL